MPANSLPTPSPVPPGQTTQHSVCLPDACLPHPAAPQVPEFRVSMSIETDKFDALYKRLKPHGVTMTALLAKAVGAALAKHPVLFACELNTT